MDQPPERERIRWGWILLCELCGVVLIGSAFALEAVWNWTGVALSTLVDLGATFALGGVLFFFERRFTARVIQASTRAVADVRNEVQAQTEALQGRIDGLQASLEDRLRRRAAQQDEAVAALDQVSFEHITAALEEANRLGALADGSLTVQAAADPDGLALEFRWGVRPQNARVEPALEISARIEPDMDSPGPRPIIEVEWLPYESPAQVGERLVEQLQQAGDWQGPETLDWGAAMRNFRRSLETAIRSRRRDPGAWALHGPLYELVGDEWAITEAGLECPPRDYFLPEDQFPEGELGGRSRLSVRNDWRPPCPGWCDEATWDRVLHRGEGRFPRPRRPALYPPDWLPWRGEAEPG